jgi:hypothetical protein
MRLTDRKEVEARLQTFSAADNALWGKMSVHEALCHLEDAFKLGLGERTTEAKPRLPGFAGNLPAPVLKMISLRAPMKWPQGVPTVPEAVVGKGGTLPSVFEQDLASLIATMNRFCDALPRPCARHAFFGEMSAADWMRWGCLYCDHHLRQFGR